MGVVIYTFIVLTDIDKQKSFPSDMGSIQFRNWIGLFKKMGLESINLEL